MKKLKKLNFLKVLDVTLISLLCISACKCVIKNFERECVKRAEETKEKQNELIKNLSQEILHNALLNNFNVKNKLDSLKKNVNDKNSIELIDTVLENVIKTLQFDNQLLCTEFQKKHFTQFAKEFNLKEKTVEECVRYYSAETVYFHHGLRFASDRIKNYVRDKDILDIGAFDGDSFLTLKNYTDKMVYCFEFSPKNIVRFHKKMKKHNISEGFILIQKGASDKKNTITIFDTGNEGVSIYHKNGENPIEVELITIDEEAKNHNMHVGFMKVDVEGHGLHVVKGAINTIKRDRPVLSLSIYHNIEEFFEIKPFLEKHLKNYIFEFQSENFYSIMSELTLFCYPKEIMK